MLYDILPPAIFFLSLGGIMVVLGRVIMRVRQQEFTTHVATAGKRTATPSELLRPAGKGIRTITSRTALVGQWTRNAATSVVSAPKTARAWWHERRTQSSSSSPANDSAPSVAGEITSPPVRRWQRWSHLGENMRASGRNAVTTSAGRARRLSASWRTVGRRSRLEQTTEAAPPSQSEEAINLDRLFPKKPVAAPAGEETKSRFRMRRVERPATAAPAHVPPRAAASKRPSRFARKQTAPLSPLAQAERAIAEAKYSHAEDILLEHIMKHTKDTAAYILLGQAAIGREAWDDAMEIFEQILEWGSTKPVVYAHLGHAAYRAGRYTKALQTLQRAHEGDPTNPMILEDLLGIARKMDNRGLVHSIEEKLHELDPAKHKAPV